MSTEVPATSGVLRRDERKRGVRRSAFWLALLAFAIYGAFILSGVLRAG